MLELVPHQKAPPFIWELLSIGEAEGEHLASLGGFELFPFRHGYAATLSPPAGESFWVSIIKFLLAYRIEFAYNKDRKPRPPETVGRDIWLKESNRYLSPERLLFFLLIFITKRNTLKKNLKSSMSIAKNPKNSDHVIMKPPPFLIRIWVWPTVPFSASGQALKLSIM